MKNGSTWCSKSICKRNASSVSRPVGRHRQDARMALTEKPRSLKHTQDFLKWKYNLTDIDTKLVDHAFIMEYEFYLPSEWKCANDSAVKYIKKLNIQAFRMDGYFVTRLTVKPFVTSVKYMCNQIKSLNTKRVKGLIVLFRREARLLMVNQIFPIMQKTTTESM